MVVACAARHPPATRRASRGELRGCSECADRGLRRRMLESGGTQTPTGRRHRGRTELARVIPHIVPERVVIRIEANLIRLIQRILNAPTVSRDAVDGGHLAGSV